MNLIEEAQRIKDDSYRCRGGVCSNCFYSKINGGPRSCSPEALRETVNKVLEKGEFSITYKKDGKEYRKLKRWETIQEGAMQSWEGGELRPIKNYDGSTIGDIPASFSDERDFYNEIKQP